MDMSGLLDRVARWLKTWALNTLNSAVYLLSLGKVTWHEGIYDWRHRWRNWNRAFTCRPGRYVRPTSEAEICQVVREASKLRIGGGGHTFNASPLTDHTLLSLDAYNRVLDVNPSTKIARVQSGIRLRDLMQQLEQHHLDLPLLGSADAQSLAGLVATDLHGTGREHGFLSEQIRAVRVVNARGEAATFRPGQPEFHAVFGALGCCGVVIELEIACVPAYNLEKSIQIVRRDWAEKNIEQLLNDHHHVSFYYLGGADVTNVRMNVWDQTDQPPKRWYPWHDLYAELVDMLFSGYLIGLARTVKAARMAERVGEFFFRLTMDGRKTVYPSSIGFRRKLYYNHDEMEYGVPFEGYQACLNEVLQMLDRHKHVSVVEVRFTPDCSQGLLGPGVGRRTCYIELAPSLSRDPAPIFAEAEAIFLRYHGQLHLGKATQATAATLQAMFGQRFTQFQAVRRQQDSTGKFTNPFTERLYGPVATFTGGAGT
jgi:L-gulonolactone oxidase